MSRELNIDFNKQSPIHKVYSQLTVQDIIDTIISHNEYINLWEKDKEEPHFSNLIWKGHAHQLPQSFAQYRFLCIKGVCAQTLRYTDTIHIEVAKRVTKELNKANEEINKQILKDGADVFEKLISENEFDDSPALKE